MATTETKTKKYIVPIRAIKIVEATSYEEAKIKVMQMRYINPKNGIYVGDVKALILESFATNLPLIINVSLVVLGTTLWSKALEYTNTYPDPFRIIMAFASTFFIFMMVKYMVPVIIKNPYGDNNGN